MVLIITGMHRSGTSLCARFLTQCGVNLGNNLMGGDKGNPYGYFEDRSILEFHRTILRDKGIGSFPENSSTFPFSVESKYELQAHEILDDISHLPIWGWKEPRTALFLEFWDRILDEKGEDVRFLFLYREPVDVVDSLVRRGTDPEIVDRPVIGLRSWIIYNNQILDFYRRNKSRSVLVKINEVIANPKHMVVLLRQKLNLPIQHCSFDDVFDRGAFQSKVKNTFGWMRILHPLTSSRARWTLNELVDERDRIASAEKEIL